MQNGGS
jgi:hypothetical protein